MPEDANNTPQNSSVPNQSLQIHRFESQKTTPPTPPVGAPKPPVPPVTTLKPPIPPMTVKPPIPSVVPPVPPVPSVTPTVQQVPVKRIAGVPLRPTQQGVAPVQQNAAKPIQTQFLQQNNGGGSQPPQKPGSSGFAGASGAPKPPLPKKGGNVLMGIMFLFVFLLIMGVVMLVLLLAQNPSNNPLLEALGIEPAALKGILSGIVNSIFGFLAFIMILITTVGIFRRVTAPKDDKPAKTRATILSISGFVLTALILFSWVMLVFYVSQLQIGARIFQGIITEPANVTELTAPIQISFSAEAFRQKYANTPIVAYNWDFNGDGKFDNGNGKDIQYTFEDKGNNNGLYNVGLQIIFEKTKPLEAQRQISIANVLPLAEAKIVPGLEGFAPYRVMLDASASRDRDSTGSVVKYEWDIDDDGRFDLEGQNVDYTFEKEGSYIVLLQVTDNNGAIATQQQNVIVKTSERTVVDIQATPGPEGTAPFAITFDGSQSVIPGSQIRSYKWSFGDGSREQTGRTVKYTYNTPGQYTVALEITGEDGKKESSVVSVNVSAPLAVPKPVITTIPKAVAGEIEGKVPLKINFSAENSTDADNNIVEYQWSFSDDTIIDEYGEKVEHTFTQAGEYTVTLKVIDADENFAKATILLTLEEPGLVAKVVADSVSGSVPLDVTFDASGSFVTDDSQIVAYKYNFGDGTPDVSGSSQQTHRYNNVGSYDATVTVRTDNGQSNTAQLHIEVLSVQLQAQFTARPLNGSAPLKVFFDANESMGDIVSYAWNFGDETVSNIKNPEHTFQDAGMYTVVLEVRDVSNNISRFQRVITVE